jgi:hypothetical protein
MDAIVHAADIQDRDGGVLLMAMLFGLSVPDEALRGCGLPGAEVSAGRSSGLPRGEHRDRAAVRRGKVRGVAEALDRREDNRLVEPMPTPQQGLGVPQPKRPGIPALGVSAIDATTPLPVPDMTALSESVGPKSIWRSIR